MTELGPFAFAPDGRAYLSADGPELLAYSGRDDTPMWKHFFHDVITGVGVTQDSVVATESDGTLRSYRLIDGEPKDVVELGIPVSGLVASPGGTVVILGESEVKILKPGQPAVSVPIAQVRAAALSTDTTLVALGHADGTLYCADTTTGATLGSVNVGHPVEGVVYSDLRQSWIASAGSSLYVVDATASTITETFDTALPTGPLAISTDHTLVAVVHAENTATIYAPTGPTKIGSVWLQRPITGLAFGPKANLGIGLTDGDANRIDLFTGGTHRTMAHPGRSQNAWPVRIQANAGLLRGEIARQLAGKGPVASQVAPKAPAAPMQPPPKKSRPLALIIGVGAAVLVCSCCASSAVVYLLAGYLGG